MEQEVAAAQNATTEVPREGTRSGRFYRPNVDIIETDEALILEADMPGTSAENVSLNYDKGTLTLHASVPSRHREDGRFLVQEYGIADFHREFVIHEEIDADGISAQYVNGVLTVQLPKSAAVKPRKISVAG